MLKNWIMATTLFTEINKKKKSQKTNLQDNLIEINMGLIFNSEDSPETWKGIRFALPLHSQALRGMVWDWRSFHSLVPKVASFGVSHEEEREHKHSQGGGSWQRITSSKKNPPPTSQKVDIYISPWYTVYAEGRQGFSIGLRGLLTTFRASEVYGSCISRICGFCEFSRQCVLL